MNEETFWRHIAAMGGVPDGDALVTSLRTESPEGVQAFADRLARLLHDLDTPAHFGQPVLEVDPDTGKTFDLPMSDDAFLYLRCTVVAAGREVYERVLAAPSALAGTWDIAEGESVLYAAVQVYEELTGDQLTFSWDVETGGNAAAWGRTENPAVRQLPWLTFGLGDGAWISRREVPDALYGTGWDLAADAELERRFAEAGHPRVDLLLALHDRYPKPRLRVSTRDPERVEVELDIEYKPGYEGADVQRWARDLLTGALTDALDELMKPS